MRLTVSVETKRRGWDWFSAVQKELCFQLSSYVKSDRRYVSLYLYFHFHQSYTSCIYRCFRFLCILVVRKLWKLEKIRGQLKYLLGEIRIQSVEYPLLLAQLVLQTNVESSFHSDSQHHVVPRFISVLKQRILTVHPLDADYKNTVIQTAAHVQPSQTGLLAGHSFTVWTSFP